jgi:16S rRNA U516 pseudouridylate synthase RsuA-like enzyme
MRIERILADRGLGSKNEVLRLLQQGRVKVNDKIIRGGNHKFHEDISIRVDNKLVEPVSGPSLFVVVVVYRKIFVRFLKW